MNILCIDYGERKIGVALATGPLADPYLVIRYQEIDELLIKLQKIIETERITQLVVGVSERDIANKSKEFGETLSAKLHLPIDYIDETLTSFDARERAIAAGIGRKKRHQNEDAYAAAIMLQSYLDTRDESI
jgi:putative Holliday junction resolvase